MSEEEALKLAKSLKGKVWGFKANALLDIMGPVRCIKELQKYGHVMADPKLHDIPNTVKNRVNIYIDAELRNEIKEVDIITVMAPGGIEMMRSAVDAVKQQSSSREFPMTKIAAVTVLTSLGEEECQINLGGPVKAKVLQYARNAVLAGCPAIVCSAQELLFLQQFPELDDLIKITPGIRPKGVSEDDQKRVNTPSEAIKNGADLLVIGRAITEAENPAEEAQKINEEIEQAIEEKEN
ncbi:orotidine-5'-phosphate decarboxylase [Candidatus Parcubacteria bacterium]|nr:orotidine-5'-phosphate decarboxylase [Candidatus Parcubacteria bacterium]